ncbi:hypothetical protein HK105_200330 [Polyrhizophydium stewartii]|uniref:DUF3533 domain-containing protein n=1 Tax=Polyrhizophydium stewartii TaxID=2732419 RepID=A0ABR4NL53_9FUNG|nr:hypothetical protein HK105_003401 [Polyrhizophydium stewartii]
MRELGKSMQELTKSQLLVANVFTVPSALIVTIATTLFATIYALAYLAMLWDPQSRMPNLKVGFINADAGFNFTGYPASFAQAIAAQTGGKTIGQIVESTILSSTSATSKMFDWRNLTGTSHAEAVDLVERNEFWQVVYIPANFSSVFLLNFNLGTPRTSPVFMNIETIYDQGRQMTVVSIANAVLAAIIKSVSNGFSAKMMAAVNSVPNATVTIMPISMQVVANNLHPVPVFGRNFATYALCMVFWLAGLMTASLLSAIYSLRLPFLQQNHIHDELTTPWRIVGSTLVMSTILGFFQALIGWGIYCGLVGSPTSAFNPDYDPFVVLLYMWFITVTFHAVSILLCLLLGRDKYTMVVSMLLILQMTTSSAILDPGVMNDFAKITYGLPFQYANRSLRCMILGSSCSFVPLNTGVLAAWYCALVGLILFVGRRQAVRMRQLVGLAQS